MRYPEQTTGGTAVESLGLTFKNTNLCMTIEREGDLKNVRHLLVLPALCLSQCRRAAERVQGLGSLKRFEATLLFFWPVRNTADLAKVE